jgi:hypothetical protein
MKKSDTWEISPRPPEDRITFLNEIGCNRKTD